MAKGKGHLEWESSKDEKYAEKWWTNNGFTWKLVKRFINYSEYEVTKDDLTVKYQIPNNGRMNIKQFMEGPAGFTKCWEQHVILEGLKKQAKAKGIISGGITHGDF